MLRSLTLNPRFWDLPQDLGLCRVVSLFWSHALGGGEGGSPEDGDLGRGSMGRERPEGPGSGVGIGRERPVKDVPGTA